MYICVRALDPLDLEWQAVVSYDVNARHLTQVLWKKSQCSYVLSRLSLQPWIQTPLGVVILKFWQ